MDIVIPSEARACPELDEENLLFPAITTAFPSTHPRLTNIQSRGACPEVSFFMAIPTLQRTHFAVDS
jgi:hypothetical protein